MDIEGGVAIVTGSSSGVGAACAAQLAEKGCNVVINYASNENGALATAAACHAYGVETVVVKADVSEDTECRALAAAALDKWGRIDALVNNAGTTKFCAHEDLEGLDKQDFLDIYAVNTVGAYQMVRAVTPAMKRAGMGSIVNVASIAGVTGVGSSIAYAASKGAMVTMTLSLARSLGSEIRVNAVCPGFIQGEWLRQGLGDEVYDNMLSGLKQTAPLGQTATADSVSNAILYFITGADIVTGETLMLDGGMHLSGAPLGRR
ncbi:MAG: SDR family oxidoreductase [Pseudomonadales bacterium]|nr:SDR family oxidoreductase [Pseudomonadales bacterium]